MTIVEKKRTIKKKPPIAGSQGHLHLYPHPALDDAPLLDRDEVCVEKKMEQQSKLPRGPLCVGEQGQERGCIQMCLWVRRRRGEGWDGWEAMDGQRYVGQRRYVEKKRGTPRPLVYDLWSMEDGVFT